MRVHGSRSMYVAGCRCEPCTKAHRDYEREQSNRRRNQDIYGASFVDGSSVRGMLELLTIPRTTLCDIAERSGVSKSVLSVVINGKQETVRRDTYDKLRPVLLSYFGEPG